MAFARLVPVLGLALVIGCGGGDETPDGGPADTGLPPDTGVFGPDEDGDQWTDDVDNCPSVPNPEQRDRDLDGIGDDCDSCPSTPNGGVGGQPGQDECEPVSEVEPNNTLGVGEMVSLVQTGRIREIRGAVEAPTPEGRQAYDRFRFMAGAQTMLHVRVARASSRSLLEPAIVVSGDGFGSDRMADGLFVAEREIYISSAGMYEVAVADRRGVLADTPIGSPDFDYALSIRAVPVEPINRTPPVTMEPFIIDATGKVPVIDMVFEPSEFTLIATETDIGGLQAETGVDTILVVERADGTVMENDDLAEGFIDSRVIASLDLQENLRIVLDHHRQIGRGPHEVRLTAAQPDTTRELEPNDRPDLASELVFPGETSGGIQAPLDPEVGPPDVDWYYLDGRAGQVVALSGLIRPAAVVNPIMALVRVYDAEAGDIETLYLNTDSSGDSPRIEGILPEDGRYYVVVGDEQNLGDPPFAGGALFEYGIFAEPTGIQPDAQVVSSTATINGVLNPGGRLKRHLVVTSEPTLVFVDTLAAGMDVDPRIRIYGPAARGQIGGGLESAMAYLPTPDSYVLAVHNDNNGIGGSAQTYRMRVGYQSVVAKAESEPNDDDASADRLDGWRDVVEGAIDPADDVDVYTVTATGGTTLDAVLSIGGRYDQVQISDGAGAVLGAGVGGVLGVPLPAIDDYRIQVTSDRVGPYTLIIRIR